MKKKKKTDRHSDGRIGLAPASKHLQKRPDDDSQTDDTESELTSKMLRTAVAASKHRHALVITSLNQGHAVEDEEDDADEVDALMRDVEMSLELATQRAGGH